MSDAKGIDDEDVPEDKKAELVEGSGQQSMEEVDEREQIQKEEGISKILSSDDFVSKPFFRKEFTVPEDILVFHHSYGYDCQQYSNLVLLEENILAFASGNLIHVFNVDTKELWFRRSAGGGGIGHMTKNPNPMYQHLAVAEKGDNPSIIIYEWLSFGIVCLLKQGADKIYSHINYSPDGEMLCSQGGKPDRLLTVWSWKESKITLQCQSHNDDVYKSTFSPSVSGHITTCGSGHIKFWKIVKTYTGYKLLESLGKFGRTETSDIIGFLALPDAKVISGCEWGNMLLWEEGLIKVEVSRKMKKSCHSAPITQFEFESGNLITVGLDGFIRMWYFDTIDAADPPEENRFIEVEPRMEFEIKNDDNHAALMCVVKILKDPEDTFWYGQDANGGIWKFDLNVKSSLRQPPHQLLVCHAGPVMDMAASPVDEHFATLGKDGRLFIYNYLEKKLRLVKRFPAQGSCLLWLPLNVDKTGTILIAGFSDGVVRVTVVSLQEKMKNTSSGEELITLIQTTKPHTKPVTALSINNKGTILVTGSEDSTVFVYQIAQSAKYISLVPIGFVIVPSAVTFLNWKPNTITTLLVCCNAGSLVEVTLPECPQKYTDVSFHLVKTETRSITFRSCKSQIRRNMKLKEKGQKLKNLEKKREEMEKIKNANFGTEVDEETFLADSEPEEELEPLYFPQVPNAILFGLYTPKDTVWLSVSGYDAGYMYEMVMDEEEPTCCTMITDADDIHIYSYLYNHNKKYLILGMENGQIRVNRVNPNDHTDLSDFWIYSMHDNTNGRIRRMCFNYDQRFMFSCGDDGNIFSYQVNFEDDGDYIIPQRETTASLGLPIQEKVVDIEDTKYLSLEETKAKIEHDKKIAITNQRKQQVLQRLEDLKIKFRDITFRNAKLPESQRIPVSDLEIHPAITKDLDDTLQRQIDLVKQNLAFDVEKSRLGLQKLQDYFINVLDSMTVYVCSIRTNKSVSTYRQRKLGTEFDDAKLAVQLKTEEAERKDKLEETLRVREIHVVQAEAPREPDRKISEMEAFLRAVPTNTAEYKANKKLQRLMKRYLQRKERQAQWQLQWDLLLKEKPDETKNHPDNTAAIKEARLTIGDYKLKSAANYIVPKHLRMSAVKKYDQLLEARKRLFLMKDNFNSKVYDLRNKKIALVQRFTELNATLKNIHRELDPTQRKFLPEIPKFDEKLEFPDKGIKLTEKDIEALLPRKTEYFGSDIPMTNQTANDKEPVDEEHEVLCSNCQETEEGTRQQIISKPYFPRGNNISTEQLEALVIEDNTDTVWETERREYRMMRKQYEQDQILNETEMKTEAFDKEVEELSHLKLRVDVETQFLELHLLTLHQELLILKDFENMDEKVTNKVLDSLKEKYEMERKIIDMQKQIQIKQTEMNDLLNEEKELEDKFNAAIMDSKFADFLRKIYKKKYKQPKLQDPDDLQSSSSSSSESDDAPSLRSDKLGLMKFDESACPEGCEQYLYDLTFVLRCQRHGYEQEVTKIRKETEEELKKEIEENLEKMKAVEAVLKINQEEREILQKEKQHKLNEVECVVLLKLSQMQHFKEDTDTLEKISNTLVFSQEALQKLYSRAEELKKETQILKDKEKNDQKHLHRMKVECQHMVGMIHKLKEDITECMFRKFGGEIDLDELEESVLRRLLAETKCSRKDIIAAYERKISAMREKLRDKQEILSRFIWENTEKLHLLTILEEEKRHLEKLSQKQAFNPEQASDKDDPYTSDIEKLIQIKEHQAAKIKALKNEIKMLSLKSKPVPPILGPAITVIPETKPEATSEHGSGAVRMG